MVQEVMSFKGNSTKNKTMSISVSLVIALAFWLIYKSTQDFLNSTVTSTIDATDIPLSEVYFPSVTLCNINQVSRFSNTHIPIVIYTYRDISKAL